MVLILVNMHVQEMLVQLQQEIFIRCEQFIKTVMFWVCDRENKPSVMMGEDTGKAEGDLSSWQAHQDMKYEAVWGEDRKNREMGYKNIHV